MRWSWLLVCLLVGALAQDEDVMVEEEPAAPEGQQMDPMMQRLIQFVMENLSEGCRTELQAAMGPERGELTPECNQETQALAARFRVENGLATPPPAEPAAPIEPGMNPIPVVAALVLLVLGGVAFVVYKRWLEIRAFEEANPDFYKLKEKRDAKKEKKNKRRGVVNLKTEE